MLNILLFFKLMCLRCENVVMIFIITAVNLLVGQKTHFKGVSRGNEMLLLWHFLCVYFTFSETHDLSSNHLKDPYRRYQSTFGGVCTSLHTLSCEYWTYYCTKLQIILLYITVNFLFSNYASCLYILPHVYCYTPWKPSSARFCFWISKCGTGR